MIKEAELPLPETARNLTTQQLDDFIAFARFLEIDAGRLSTAQVQDLIFIAESYRSAIKANEEETFDRRVLLVGGVTAAAVVGFSGLKLVQWLRWLNSPARQAALQAAALREKAAEYAQRQRLERENLLGLENVAQANKRTISDTGWQPRYVPAEMGVKLQPLNTPGTSRIISAGEYLDFYLAKESFNTDIQVAAHIRTSDEIVVPKLVIRNDFSHWTSRLLRTEPTPELNIDAVLFEATGPTNVPYPSTFVDIRAIPGSGTSLFRATLMQAEGALPNPLKIGRV